MAAEVEEAVMVARVAVMTSPELMELSKTRDKNEIYQNKIEISPYVSNLFDRSLEETRVSKTDYGFLKIEFDQFRAYKSVVNISSELLKKIPLFILSEDKRTQGAIFVFFGIFKQRF